MAENIPTTGIGKEKVLEALPHRPPFLFVDDVKDLVLFESCTGIKTVHADDFYFKGHFPDFPIMPGVLMLEALAQAAGVLVYWSLKDTYDLSQKNMFLTTIEKAKFKRSIFPEDTMELFIQKEHFRHPIYKTTGEVRVKDEVMATATISAMIVPKQQKQG